MLIQHDENGDSEYIGRIKLRVSAEDDCGSTVSIGNISLYTIVKKSNGKYSIIENSTDREINDNFLDKWQAVDYIIHNKLMLV